MSNYTPGKLFDAVKAEFGIYTDRDLAKLLETTPNEISIVRTHHTGLNADLILKVHHVTGWGIDYIRGLAGDESERCFTKPVGGKLKWRWIEHHQRAPKKSTGV